MEPPSLSYQLYPRPQVKVVGIAQKDLCPHLFKICRGQALYGSLTPHRHKRWGGKRPVGSDDLAHPPLSLPLIQELERELLGIHMINIEDISQTILQDMFSMILIVDISACKASFESLQEALQQEGNLLGLKVLMQHKKIFDFMHRI